MTRSILTRALFVAWAGGLSLSLTYLMATHSIPLPDLTGVRPDLSHPNDPSIHAQGSQTWTAVHILAAGCRCSANVGAYLVARGSRTDLVERVWWVTEDGEEAGKGLELSRELKRAGFDVIFMPARDVARNVGVSGGPWLILQGPNGQTAYSGGYGPSRAGARGPFQDLQLLARLQGGEHVAPFPVFGCATDPSTREALDPWGLKRASTASN